MNSRILKTLSAIICVILLLSVFPVSAAKNYTSGYYTYSKSGSKATIVSVDTDISGDVEIPSLLDSYTVTTIGSSAFKNCADIESIVIPDTVTTIRAEAFRNCSKLKSVAMSANISLIEKYAFYNTAFYSDYNNWENGILYAGKALVAAQTSLSGSCSIKDGTSVIEDRAFYGCESVTEVNMTSSVKKVGEYAFFNCGSLKNVYYIGDTDSLSRISIGDNNLPLTDALWHCEGYLYLAGCQACDMNGDGSIDNRDLTRLFQFLSGWDVEIVRGILDVNGDAALNNKDLMRLFKFISDWEVDVYPKSDEGMPSIGGDLGPVIVF